MWNKNKKAFANRRRLESILIQDLYPLTTRGSHLNSCMEKDANSQKYKIAKKRYLDLLNDAESNIKKIKNMIELMEKDSIKTQKKEKLKELDEERNKAIIGEIEEEDNERR